MRVVDTIVQILAEEGVIVTFGILGTAINGPYSALEADGRTGHIPARHDEAQSHMAEGYTRARVGNIGVCPGASGPAGTDMVMRIYFAMADSLSILRITSQVPTPKLDKEDLQGVDIASIAAPVTKYAKTVLEPTQTPGIFQKAPYLMREGRSGPALTDLPGDVQTAETDFDVDAYEPIEAHKLVASDVQVIRLVDLIAPAERPVLLMGGGVIQSDDSDTLVDLAETFEIPVISALIGWGTIPDDHALPQGMAGIQTSQQYANAMLLSSDFVTGIGSRRANRMMGDPSIFREGREFVYVDVEPSQIGRVSTPDLGIVSDIEALIVKLADKTREYKEADKLADQGVWAKECDARKATMQRKTAFENVPLKPQRVYQAMNGAFGRDARYVMTIGPPQIQAAQLLYAYKYHHRFDAGQAGPLGWTTSAAIDACVADPDTPTVAFSGDFDFNFLIEELAMAVQFNVPRVHVLANSAYLSLIRQLQRAFDMDYCVQLSFENINSPETEGHGVDHVKVAEGLGCKVTRVRKSENFVPALRHAWEIADELKVPVVVECVLERVTSVSMGTALDSANEFEPFAEAPEDVPAAVLPLEPKWS